MLWQWRASVNTYDEVSLYQILEKYFPRERLLGNPKHPKFFTTAIEESTGKPTLKIFSNYMSESRKYVQGTAFDAACATASTPSLFKPYTHNYVNLTSFTSHISLKAFYYFVSFSSQSFGFTLTNPTLQSLQIEYSSAETLANNPLLIEILQAQSCWPNKPIDCAISLSSQEESNDQQFAQNVKQQLKAECEWKDIVLPDCDARQAQQWVEARSEQWDSLSRSLVALGMYSEIQAETASKPPKSRMKKNSR